MSPRLCPKCQSPITFDESRQQDVFHCAFCGAAFSSDEGDGTIALASSIGDDDELWEALIDITVRNIGRFEIECKVGQGSFGTVYKARDLELGRSVAIKIPRFGQLSTPLEMKRFQREARHVAQFRHEGIVSVLDVGWTDNVPYLVSDFIEGETLAKVIAGRRLPLGEVVHIVCAVADALEFAHGHGVVHRDVKPSNIMIDGDGSVKLMDFGLARGQQDVTLTQAGQILGTPAYMSPEQATGDGNSTNVRSDVYSLGVVFYEMLTGERPFRGNQRMLIHHVIHDVPRQPRSLNDTIPTDLDTICQKTLEREPHRRYQTAGELAADLRRWTNHEPIQARRIGAAGRLQRWYRRNPVVAKFLASIFLIIGVAAGIAFGLLITAGERLHDSEIQQSKAFVSNAKLNDPMISTESLPWLVGALKLDIGKPERERASRIRIANALQRCPELLLMAKHDASVADGCFTSDGKFAVTVSNDKTARVWDVEARKQDGKPLLHEETLSSCAISPNNRYLVCGCDDGQAYLWDFGNRTLLKKFSMQSVNGDSGDRYGVRKPRFAMHNDQQILATAAGPYLRVWDVARDAPLASFDFENSIREIQFSQDRQSVLIAMEHGEIYSWQWREAREPQPEITRAQLGNRPAYATLSERSDTVAVGHHDGHIFVWEAASNDIPSELARAERGILSAKLSPDGTILTTFNSNSILSIWRTDESSRQPPLEYSGIRTRGTEFSSDSRFMARIDDRTSQTMLFDMRRNQPFTLMGQNSSPLAFFRFSPDDSIPNHRVVLTVSVHGEVYLWKIPTTPSVVATKPIELPNSYVKSPTSSRVALLHSRRSHAVMLFDTENPAALPMTVLPTHVGNERHAGANITAFAFGEQDHIAATGDDHGNVITWEIADEIKQVQQFQLDCSVNHLEFHKSCKLLIAAGNRRGRTQSVIWDLETDQKLWESSTEHSIHRAATFLNDEPVVATVSDKTIRIEALDGSRPLRELAHESRVERFAVDPTGNRILALTFDLHLHLWDLETAQAIWTPVKLPDRVTHFVWKASSGFCALGFQNQFAQRWSLNDQQPDGMRFSFAGKLESLDLSNDGTTALISTSAGNIHPSVAKL